MDGLILTNKQWGQTVLSQTGDLRSRQDLQSKHLRGAWVKTWTDAKHRIIQVGRELIEGWPIVWTNRLKDFHLLQKYLDAVGVR